MQEGIRLCQSINGMNHFDLSTALWSSNGGGGVDFMMRQFDCSQTALTLLSSLYCCFCPRSSFVLCSFTSLSRFRNV